MLTYPINVSNMKPGIDSGRLVYLSEETITELTPRDVLPFIAEGFAVVTKTTDAETGKVEFSFVAYKDDLDAAENPSFTVWLGTNSFGSTGLDEKFTDD